MKLSIITVNLNNRDGLKKTIDSVVSQTFRDFEWIVIDGGSTDGSKELIEQYADHFAYWVSEPDKGVYNAMNKGIKVANGEYLQFLNSGDWLVDETALERCFSHHFTADIAYGDLYFCDGDKRELYKYPERLTFRFLYDYSLGHNASFIKRERLIENPYNENLKIVSDWDFYVKQALNNSLFEYIDEIVSCFDTTGISTSNWELVKSERNRVLKDYLSVLFVRDYETMDEMKHLLEMDHVRRVIEYGNKRKLYHKMITGCLKVIERIEKCHGK